MVDVHKVKANMINVIRPSYGIALIQALILSVVLSVIVLSVNSSAQSQLVIAAKAEARAKALLDTESAQSKLELDLLLRTSTSASEPSHFNKYGQSFLVDTVEAQLQDLNGLYSIPPYGASKLIELLEVLEVPKAQAVATANALVDWQDADNIQLPAGAEQSAYPDFSVRNSPLQTLQELSFVKGFSPDIVERLRIFTTLYPTQAFNPLTAPAAMLRTYISATDVKELERLRRTGQLNALMLFRISGLQDGDNITTVAGPGYLIHLTTTERGIKLRRSWVAVYDPYKPEPVNIWQMQRVALSYE